MRRRRKNGDGTGRELVMGRGVEVEGTEEEEEGGRKEGRKERGKKKGEK